MELFTAYNNKWWPIFVSWVKKCLANAAAKGYWFEWDAIASWDNLRNLFSLRYVSLLCSLLFMFPQHLAQSIVIVQKKNSCLTLIEQNMPSKIFWMEKDAIGRRSSNRYFVDMFESIKDQPTKGRVMGCKYAWRVVRFQKIRSHITVLYQIVFSHRIFCCVPFFFELRQFSQRVMRVWFDRWSAKSTQFVIPFKCIGCNRDMAWHFFSLHDMFVVSVLKTGILVEFTLIHKQIYLILIIR